MLAFPAQTTETTSFWVSLLPTLLAAWAVLAGTFCGLWLRQCRTRNATSVDAAWAGAIGLVAVVTTITGSGATVQRALAGAIGGLWSLRLSWHLLRDRVFASGAGEHREDGRYRAMREHWGARAPFHFFWFYQAQALAALAFATPFVALARHPSPNLSNMQWLGLAIVVLAQIAEAISDRQLAAHRRDPSQRHLACRRGLWRYSRHPNYFFEWLTWCGIGLFAAPAMGWYATLQPAVMYVLVRFVSGVPWNELQSLKTRGADYRSYMQETNTFMPWLPRAVPKDVR
jgi:steroid 5-alpha reductase family enzyme